MNGASQRKINQGLHVGDQKVKRKNKRFASACAFGRSLPSVGMTKEMVFSFALILKRELKHFQSLFLVISTKGRNPPKAIHQKGNQAFWEGDAETSSA